MEITQKNGLAFFEMLKKDDQTYNEYIPAEGFIGEYVAKLEQQTNALSGGSGNESSLEQPSTPAPSARLPRWKRRTYQQIEANKLAQKRYRERKKAKLQDASAKVDSLQQQTQNFKSLEDEIKSRNADNADLEAQLMSLEAELQSIRIELDAKTPQGKFESQSKISRILGPSTLDAKTESVAEKWQKAIAKLGNLLESEQLDPRKNLVITKAQDTKLQKRCLAAVEQCMQMLTIGGPALEDLLRTLPGGVDLLRKDDLQRYAELVQSLNLQPQQLDSVKALLPSVSSRLAKIYAERQELNQKVLVLLMAPKPFDSTAEVSTEQATLLRKALKDLQDNLTQEQRLESEHHYNVLREILTPLQAAWFIQKTYPRHCDTLAFMQAVRALEI